MANEEREHTPGEHLLYQAVMHRLLSDLNCPTPLPYGATKVGGRTTLLDQLLAVEAIVDEDGGVVEWSELLGIDGSAVRELLLREAGLVELL
jgi:hypothetical protein